MHSGFANPQFRTFSNEPICIEDKVQTPVSNNGWTARSATITVVADGWKSLIGWHLFNKLGLEITESSSVIESTLFPHIPSSNKTLRSHSLT